MSVASPFSNYPICRWITSLAFLTALGLTGCHLGHSLPPTRVESGLLYNAGQSEFDAFFKELHEQQTELLRAPEEERKLRRELAQRLDVTAGATPQILIDTVTQRARQLADKKIFLRMAIEGFGAEDEADTMVQTTVIGTLDDPGKAFVENATLLARLELRHAAKLHKANRQLSRLTVHAQALEPSVEPHFGSQGYLKLEEVKRNLQAAKRTLPLLSLQATDQADGCEQLVRKLSVAITTDLSLTEKNEPPLIAPNTTSKRTRNPAWTPRRSNGAAAPKPKAEPATPPSTDPGDFAP